VQSWSAVVASLTVASPATAPAAVAGLAAAVVAFALIWLLRPVALRRGWLDHPAGRKDHEISTPTTGGLAMLLAMAVGLALRGVAWNKIDLSFLAAGALLVAVGMLDDRHDLRWWLRVAAQCFAVWLVYQSGVAAAHVGNLFGLATTGLGAWQLPFTMFATVGVINAINMSDGVDGLGGGIVLATLCMFGAAAVYSGNVALALKTAVFAGAVLGFWLLNMRFPWQGRARVFMGNAGSALLGFTIAWTSLRLTQNDAHPVTPILAPWLVATPLLDCVVLIGHRLRNRQSPFHADRNHMHHLMLEAGFAPARLVWTLMALNLALGLAASIALLLHVPQSVLVLVYVGMCLWYFWLTGRRERALRFFTRLRHPFGGAKPGDGRGARFADDAVAGE